MNKGFTLIELLIAMTVFSVIGVASMSLIFSGLSLRDQTMASTNVTDQLRVLAHTMRRAIIDSKVVTGNSYSLFLASDSDCWSFVYDNSSKQLKYKEITTPDCVPDTDPQDSFFPSSTQVTSWQFSITPMTTGGRQVTVAGDMSVPLPFGKYETSFSDTYTNLID